MDVTKLCSMCKMNKPINDYIKEPTGQFHYRTCIRCREAVNEKNAAKRARQDEMIPQTAGPPPKRRKTYPPLSEISSNAQIFNLHEPVHTWNRKAEEDKEQAAARRLQDARAKKLRDRQRAVRRGETPPPLTPSQSQPFTPPGRHPPVPAPPPARVIMRPVPNAKYFTCSVCAAERHIDVLINRGIDDDAVCLYCFHLRADGDAVVPIVPIMREWEVSHQKLQRTAFPVVLAYAITVHKSQGLTLDRVVLDLTLKDFAMGLTYVAISRARSLNGIMFLITKVKEKMINGAILPTTVRRLEPLRVQLRKPGLDGFIKHLMKHPEALIGLDGPEPEAAA